MRAAIALQIAQVIQTAARRTFSLARPLQIELIVGECSGKMRSMPHAETDPAVTVKRRAGRPGLFLKITTPLECPGGAPSPSRLRPSCRRTLTRTVSPRRGTREGPFFAPIAPFMQFFAITGFMFLFPF